MRPAKNPVDDLGYSEQSDESDEDPTKAEAEQIFESIRNTSVVVTELGSVYYASHPKQDYLIRLCAAIPVDKKVIQVTDPPDLPLPESSAMTAFKIPEFSGENGEDVDVFTQFVSYGFMPMASTFVTGGEKDKAKAFLLLSNTTGIARSWILKQPKTAQESYTSLCEVLKVRFPVKQPADGQEKAISNDGSPLS